MADLVPAYPVLSGGLVKGKDQSQAPSKPMPNVANPTAGPAFVQAPRAFMPMQTAFKAR